MIYWHNGEWRDDPVSIRIDDRGFLLGDGVFETILVRKGTPLFWERHLARLSQGLQIFLIKARLPENIRAVISELAARNGFSDCDAALRLTVTRGQGARGLAPVSNEESAPTILLSCAPAPQARSEARTMVISQGVRANGVTSRCKVAAYGEHILALNEAMAKGADDAVLLTPQGRVACASAANLFLITVDGAVATPPIADGALPGVVRGVLLERASASGIDLGERPIAPEELQRGALFLTNSLIGLAPARLKEAPGAPPCEIFNFLDACYQQAIMENMKQGGAP